MPKPRPPTPSIKPTSTPSSPAEQPSAGADILFSTAKIADKAKARIRRSPDAYMAVFEDAQTVGYVMEDFARAVIATKSASEAREYLQRQQPGFALQGLLKSVSSSADASPASDTDPQLIVEAPPAPAAVAAPSVEYAREMLRDLDILLRAKRKFGIGRTARAAYENALNATLHPETIRRGKRSAEKVALLSLVDDPEARELAEKLALVIARHDEATFRAMVEWVADLVAEPVEPMPGRQTVSFPAEAPTLDEAVQQPEGIAVSETLPASELPARRAITRQTLSQSGLKRQRAAADLRLLEDKAREAGVGMALFGLLSGQLRFTEAFPETALRDLQTLPAIPYGKQVAPHNRFNVRAANARKLIAAVSRSLNILSDFERPRAVVWIIQNLRRDTDLQQAA